MKDKDSAPSSIARVTALRTLNSEKYIDSVVVEEPLEIRIRRDNVEEHLGITMRTPGADLDLTAGFLWGEGFISSPEQLLAIKVCGDRKLTPRQRANIVIADVASSITDVSGERSRRSVMSSACGICGSSNIADLHQRGVIPVRTSEKSDDYLASTTQLLKGRQNIFERTGGLHAALLVAPDREVHWVREDVGRHNAVDKVIGAALMDGKIPLADWTLVVSGRIGYEIVQKAIVSGISALVGVSAPTSLAIDLAQEFNLTLMAFARGGQAKKYSPMLG